MMSKMTGDSATRSTLEAVRRFNEAFDRHDVDGVMAAMSSVAVRLDKEGQNFRTYPRRRHLLHPRR